MSQARTGRQAILEQFLADGMDHMFGNPGTVEQGFLDALSDYPQLKYVLTLQESVAVLCADGYARATHKPTLVQLHSSPGIGNAVGALYQAKRGHAPLVVIAGDAGLQYMNMDAQMAADLVAMMEPVTKYATMVLDPRNLLRTLRRAIKIAATPPMGPVYVCLPADVLDQPNSESVFPSCIPSTRVAPDPALIDQAASMLLAGERPRIYLGDGVAHSGAAHAVTEVAERLGAQVYGVDIGDLNMDTTHPCYQGSTGHMFGEQSLPILRGGDANLIVGTYMVPEVFPELGDIFDPAASVVHVDLDAYEIAKNHRVDLGVVSDPLLSMQALAAELDRRMTPAQRQTASERVSELGRLQASAVAAERAADDAVIGTTPLDMAAFARELAARVNAEKLVIVDEALTSSPALTRYVPATTPGHYFVTRGGSLGIGVPGAIGVKAAFPDRQVIGFSGDGGSMYTIQALYTARRHNLGAKFVICNNGSYRLLQLNISQWWRSVGLDPHDNPLPFDLSHPALDFVSMAAGMGVAGVRVETPEQIGPAIERMLADDEPFLIDLVVGGDVNPEQVGLHCGQ